MNTNFKLGFDLRTNRDFLTNTTTEDYIMFLYTKTKYKDYETHMLFNGDIESLQQEITSVEEFDELCEGYKNVFVGKLEKVISIEEYKKTLKVIPFLENGYIE